MQIGRGHCCVCWGTCCPLVNTVLSTLVEAGELSDDAEVGVYFVIECIYFVIIEYSCRNRCLYTQAGKFKNRGGSGWEAGIFVSV